MKWIIALVLCFTFPWVGVPMLLVLLAPIISDLYTIQVRAAYEIGRSTREQQELDRKYHRS